MLHSEQQIRGNRVKPRALCTRLSRLQDVTRDFGLTTQQHNNTTHLEASRICVALVLTERLGHQHRLRLVPAHVYPHVIEHVRQLLLAHLGI